MAWHHDTYFNTNLVLPRSMNTRSQVIELRNVNPSRAVLVEDRPQITVYENMKVDLEVHKYWMQQAHTHKYSVPLPKLSAESILLWTDPRSVDRWKDIDPYLDLEDVSSDKANETPETPSVPVSPLVKYMLRIRKPKRQ